VVGNLRAKKERKLKKKIICQEANQEQQLKEEQGIRKNTGHLNSQKENIKIENNMFGKKLKKKDLTELRKRIALINEHVLIAQALELQKRFWLNEKIKELGFDITKSYEVLSKNGKIKEVKTPKVEVNKNEPKSN